MPDCLSIILIRLFSESQEPGKLNEPSGFIKFILEINSHIIATNNSHNLF